MFPGAAVASITCAAASEGGARTIDGKQDALSWSMILPSLSNGESLIEIEGWNWRREGTKSPGLRSIIRQAHIGDMRVRLIKKRKKTQEWEREGETQRTTPIIFSKG